jgi:hypothetical protein
MRWLPFLIAMSCATGLKAEDILIVHHARYEVITDDPSCNGPHERLIRAQLDVPDMLRGSQQLPLCFVELRKGLELERTAIPCPTASPLPKAETGILPSDTVSLRGTVDICQGLLDISASIPSAELIGTLGGEPIDPVSLDVDYIRFKSGTSMFEEKGSIKFSLSCWENRVNGNGSPLDVDIYLRLSEGDDKECGGASCPEVVEVTNKSFWGQFQMAADCSDVAAEASP